MQSMMIRSPLLIKSHSSFGKHYRVTRQVLYRQLSKRLLRWS
eukprot:08490.XXX_136818_136943_1 [CDS] Oithona nana genome sequencing.